MTNLTQKLMGSGDSSKPASRIKQNTINPQDQKRIAAIKTAILAEGDRIRARYPILQYQDAIGMAILIGSMLGAGLTAWAYLQGVLVWYVTIPVIAIFLSFTHELEHDLIHYMYFRKNKFMHNLMMALVWISRPSVINPWARRHIHLHHHLHSGTETDIEERSITNGLKFSLARLWMMFDLNWGIKLRALRLPSALRKRAFGRIAAGNFPLATVFWALWHVYFVYWVVEGLSMLVGVQVPWPAVLVDNMDTYNAIAVVLLAPNLLRSFSINFISSNMHYYGDVEDGNFVQQCQVLNSKWFIIPHLFCFNFGSTHGIHHFVVRDPFYLRQMTAKKAHEVMRAQGVRFNDLGTFRRSNRWGEAAQAQGDAAPQHAG
jgi:hypothetical protein